MSNEVRETRSFRRYLLETTAVLSGILIAFGLDAGWGLLRERAELRESLVTLQQEFQGTRTQQPPSSTVPPSALKNSVIDRSLVSITLRTITRPPSPRTVTAVIA